MTGNLFRDLVNGGDSPLSILGTVNAYSALLAKKSGAKAIYLSGSGVSASSLGLPDLGFNTLEEVLIDARRITNICDLPLLVDIDTGFGSIKSIQKTIKLIEKSGVAAIHIEDQVDEKRCGHRPNKKLVSISMMKDRIKAAVDAREDESFVIMARSDALAVENEKMLHERLESYIEAGADMIFPEALTKLSQYKYISKNFSSPLLANITEFGKTPLFTKNELKNVGVSMILYPLSAFRAMSSSAERVYSEIIKEGSQKKIINQMQTRNELYDYLSYYDYENEIDKIVKNIY